MAKRAILFAAGLLLTIASMGDKYCSVAFSDVNKIRLTLRSGDISVTTATTNLGNHSVLSIDGFFPSADNVGKPCLPVLSRRVEIPLCKGVSYKIISTATESYTAQELGITYPLYPTQAPRSKSDEGPIELIKDAKVYATNALYAKETIVVEKIGVARNTNLADVFFSPISYNPVSGQIVVIKEIELEITFEEPDMTATRSMKKKHHSPAYSVKADVPTAITKDGYTSGPIRYLIVAHETFRDQMDTFIEWKRRKGFMCDIVYTDQSEVGNTTESIAAYLKAQYTNATAELPAPTYVLLVGDVQQIPAFDSRITSSWLNDHITDLYYFTWTDGDIIPDCYYGRFSAQDVSDLTPQVDKTLMYEQYTMSDPSYLDKALIVAGVDGGTAGDHGYTHADPVIHYLEDNYTTEEYGYTEVTSYYNPESGTSGARSGVFNALSGGVGYANYTAHCNYDNWSQPRFNNSDVARMENTEKFGLMIGNCCLSSKFDVNECLAEALLRKGNYRGAVGYIGGSNSTYWDQDYYWAVGVRSINRNTCPTPSYNANQLGAYDRLFHTHGESYADWYTSNGAIIMAGNMSVQASSSSSNYKTYYWEIYHLMGDPSVMSWLTQADEMTVQAPTTIFNDATSLRVEAVPYAYVAFTGSNHELIAATFADANGVATLSFAAPDMVGTFEVAVSAQNYQTAFVPVQVIVPEGPFAAVTAMTTDTTPTAGTDMHVVAQVSNIGVDNADSVWVVLHSADESKLMVYDTMFNIGAMTVGQADTLVCTARVLSSTAAGERLAIYATVHYDGGNTSLYTYRFNTKGHKVVNTYTAIRPSTADRSYLLGGDTVMVEVKYKNAGSLPMRQTKMNFVSPNPMVEVSHGSETVAIFPVGAEITRTFRFVLSADIAEGAIVPIYNTVSTNGYTYRDTILLPIGSIMETFESNSLATLPWTQGEYPWEITTSEVYEGTYALRSKSWASGEGNNCTSEISLTWTSVADDSIVYYRKTSSETNYDEFHFYIDGAEQETESGIKNYKRRAYFVPAGTHTFKWAYSKDVSVGSGQDCAWVDNIKLPFAEQIHYVHIADTTCMGTTYQNGNIEVNTAGLEPGTHYYTDNMGADSVRFIMLTVAATPDVQISGNTTINYLESTKLTATGALNYAWNIGENTATISVNPYHTTAYTVVGSAKGCMPDTATTTVVVNNSGITEADNNSHIRLYPNPATTHVTIAADEPMASIAIYNALGQALETIDAQGATSLHLGIGKLSGGVYIIGITTQSNKWVSKHLIINR